jgi:hypothetical protein
MLSTAKGYKFQSISEALTAKLNGEKKDSANNSFNGQLNNSPKGGNGPKMMKIVKGGNNQIQIQLGNNIYKPEVTKSLTPTSVNDVPSINFNAYNSNNPGNSGFYNKLLQGGNSLEVKKLAETKRSNNEKLRKDKLDLEMKILEEDFNDENPKESYYKNNKKEEEKEKEKQSSLQTKKKTGILNLFSKILPK